VTEYPSFECRYCIDQARKREREHGLEIERLNEEIESLKIKLGCQEAFVDKLLLLIKPKKGAPIMDGLKGTSPTPVAKLLQSAQTKFMTDSPYHQ
jgi:hypothetical protein